jgi:hypothetical protein
MSAQMVRALLSGTKTQTRRVVKPLLSEREWVEDRENGSFWRCADGEPTCYTGVWETHEYAQQFPVLCPYGHPGDQLWVREAFSPYLYREGCWYWADGNIAAYDCEKPKPSIHMWRWASRITLEVTGVRVERLQDISEADAIAEGSFTWAGEQDTPVRDLPEARLVYRQLWEDINGPGSWDANPWVWCVDFKSVEAA